MGERPGRRRWRRLRRSHGRRRRGLPRRWVRRHHLFRRDQRRHRRHRHAARRVPGPPVRRIARHGDGVRACRADDAFTARPSPPAITSAGGALLTCCRGPPRGPRRPAPARPWRHRRSWSGSARPSVREDGGSTDGKGSADPRADPSSRGARPGPTARLPPSPCDQCAGRGVRRLPCGRLRRGGLRQPRAAGRRQDRAAPVPRLVPRSRHGRSLHRCCRGRRLPDRGGGT